MSAPVECMRCRSTRLIPMVRIADQGQYSDGMLKAVVTYTNPEAWVFKGPVQAQLKATICGECGHTELTTENAPDLYRRYLAHRSRGD